MKNRHVPFKYMVVGMLIPVIMWGIMYISVHLMEWFFSGGELRVLLGCMVAGGFMGLSIGIAKWTEEQERR